MHNRLDIHPVPENTLYINDVAIANDVDYFETIQRHQQANRGEGFPQDNIRVYVPLDINRDFMLMDLRKLYSMLGSPNEDNESSFISGVGKIIARLEIYDQVWTARNYRDAVRFSNVDGTDALHSKQAIETANEIIAILKNDEGSAECFPAETIDELRRQYFL